MKDTLDSDDGDEDGDEDGGEDFSQGYEPEYHPEADDAGVFWCPKCGAEMYGDSTRCSTCGDYVTPGSKPSVLMPWWIWAGMAAVALALLAGLIAAFR